MTEPASVESAPQEAASKKPTPIHKTGTTAHGRTVSAGYYVVGPSGQLVLQRPDQPVKSGWRLATDDDVTAKQELERKRRGRDRSGEHDDRAAQADRAAGKAAAVAAGRG
jgi:hypothetical protein